MLLVNASHWQDASHDRKDVQDRATLTGGPRAVRDQGMKEKKKKNFINNEAYLYLWGSDEVGIATKLKVEVFRSRQLKVTLS